MKKTFFKNVGQISMALLFFVALASFGGKFETKTVTGEILDMKCYMGSGDHGDSHQECAKMCLKGGSPMGILGDDNKVYLLIAGKDTAPYEEAKNHGGEMMTVTGTLSEKGGLQALIVTEAKLKK